MFVRFKAEKTAQFSTDGHSIRTLKAGEIAEIPTEIAQSLEKQKLGKMLGAPENKAEQEAAANKAAEEAAAALKAAQDGSQGSGIAPKTQEELASMSKEDLVELSDFLKLELPKPAKNTSKIDLIEAIIKKQG